jgi:hypothetical protein
MSAFDKMVRWFDATFAVLVANGVLKHETVETMRWAFIDGLVDIENEAVSDNEAEKRHRAERAAR